jgi:hypothetical protein
MHTKKAQRLEDIPSREFAAGSHCLNFDSRGARSFNDGQYGGDTRCVFCGLPSHISETFKLAILSHRHLDLIMEGNPHGLGSLTQVEGRRRQFVAGLVGAGALDAPKDRE